MSKDDEPLLDIEEPYYVLESPDVLIVPHNTPVDHKKNGLKKTVGPHN